jgi:hypothetical protein
MEKQITWNASSINPSNEVNDDLINLVPLWNLGIDITLTTPFMITNDNNKIISMTDFDFELIKKIPFSDLE